MRLIVNVPWAMLIKHRIPKKRSSGQAVDHHHFETRKSSRASLRLLQEILKLLPFEYIMHNPTSA